MLKRKRYAPNRAFTGSSIYSKELEKSRELAIDYIAAPPRMAKYMEYSADIYNVYLKYVAPEDIHVYSIDEVFMDVTSYLKTTNLSPREFTKKLLRMFLILLVSLQRQV